MVPITADEAEEYCRRWELLDEIELAALRRGSTATKLRQLSTLMASRGLFGVDPERERDLQPVRERWARLWQALGD